MLRGFTQQVREKSGGFLLFSGEAGVGKSRLVQEAGEIAEAQGTTVLRVACQDVDRGVAYSPWIELIRDFLHRTPKEEFYRIARPHLSALTKLAPELGDLIWLYDPSAVPAEWERRPFLAAISRFFVSISEGSPLLILIDDVGWADAASIELLETLVTISRGSALGIVGAYRDTHLEDNPALQKLLLILERQKSFVNVALSPLDQDHLGEFIGAVLGRSTVPREFQEVVYAKTRGNPFYTREVLQSLADVGVIYQSAEGWSWSEVSTISLPSTVGRTIEGRLGRLDEESLRVLRIASMLGLEFPFELLRRVAEVSDEALLTSLEKAVTAKLLKETTSSDRRSSHQFSHPLIQEVLEGGVSQMRAQRVHLQAARVLEAMYGSGASEHAASLAYHYLRGNDLERALDYSVRAGDRAASVFARAEAVGHYHTALELLGKTDQPGLSCRIKEAMADQRRGLSEISDAAKLYEEVGRDWEAAGNRSAAGNSLRKAAECFQGSLAHEMELRARALQLLEQAPPGAPLVLLYLSNGLTTYDQGRVPEARAEYQSALTLAQRLGDVESQTWALLRLAFCAPTDQREEFASFTGEAERLVLDHRLAGPVVGQLQLNKAAFAYHCLGDVHGPGGVVAGLEALLKAARASNDLERESWVIGFALPWVYLRAGNLRVAWEAIEERRRRYRFVGLAGWAPNSETVGVRAWVGTLLGPLDRAKGLLAEAVEIGRERPNWFIDAMTFQFLGRHALARGDPDKSIPHLEQALDCHRRAGFPAWHTQWTCETLGLLVRAHLGVGDSELAREKSALTEELANKIRSDPARAFALRARGLLAIDGNQVKEALHLLEECRGIWERLGWKYDLGTTWFDTGNAFAAAGDHSNASTAFREAHLRFGEVGAQSDVDRAMNRLEGMTF